MTTLQTNSETQEINVTIKRGLLDSRKRQLIINPSFIQFEDKDLLSDPFTRFEKDEIADYRFGINWIKGFEFTIVREYQIFIRNTDSKALKINFKSFYGIMKNELNKLYADILKALWQFYFADITNDLLTKYRDGESIEVSDVQISNNGLTIKSSGIFKEQKKTIAWEKVGTSDYYTYFNIHSIEDIVNVNRGYS